MRTELKNLEITQTDLKNLSGITSESYLDSPKNGILWKTIIWFFPALFVSVILVVILFSILEALGRTYDEWVALLSFVFFVLAFPLARYAAKNIGTKASKIYQNSSYYKKTEIEAFLSLKIEVERFNNLIKAIDVNDQLEEAGNKGMDLNNRNKIIEALELARKDLVRALKTEKILRDNKDIIINNPDLFANNLSNLQALQINDKATEYGQLLNQALQIAVEVQEEMRKLKNQH
jgi:NACalpha-BTF3-like transcription factor